MMLRLIILLTLISLKSVSLPAQLIITNTTVVDVEKRKLLPSMQVLVVDGVITEIGTKVSVPNNARVIDGSGKFLVPGFADAHVHFFQSGGAYTRPDIVDLRKFRPYTEEIKWAHQHMENQLRRYTRVGITTVVDVGSTINFLKQRDTFRLKDYAPTVYMTGPLLVTAKSPVYEGLLDDDPFYLMRTEDETRNYVHLQLPYKPDFIKIGYVARGKNKDSVARSYFPLVKIAIEEAHKMGLKVAVHAFEKLTAQLAVEAGADHLVHTPVDGRLEPGFIEMLKKRKVSISSSAIVNDGYFKTFMQTFRPTPLDIRYAHPEPMESILQLKDLPDTALTENLRRRFQAMEPDSKKEAANLSYNLKMLADAGVILVTATDAGNIGTQHASSYFQELEVMQQSGLDTWQLLQASTINVAHALGKQDEFGSISKGKRADMVLLSQNPIDNLANWTKVDYVFIRGVAWKPEQILPFTSR